MTPQSHNLNLGWLSDVYSSFICFTSTILRSKIKLVAINFISTVSNEGSLRIFFFFIMEILLRTNNPGSSVLHTIFLLEYADVDYVVL